MRLKAFAAAGLWLCATIGACSPPSPLAEPWRVCGAFEGDLKIQADACTAIIEANDPAFSVATAYANRGQARARSGQSGEAMADFSQAIRLDPNAYEGYYYRAVAYDDAGDHDRALADLDIALRLNPDQPSMLNQACWDRAVTGSDLEGAISLCNRVIELAPQQAGYLDSRGLLNLKRQRFEAALSDYEAAMQLAPNYAHYIYGHGIALIRLGRGEEGQANSLQQQSSIQRLAKNMRAMA